MKSRRIVYGAAFVLPVGLYMIVMLAARVIPFGDNSMLIWDANYFYSSFLNYWRGALLGQQDFLYSFNRTLGQSMAGLSSYFLLSPLNALLLLFPDSAMALAYSVLILVKTGLCGLTFMIYMQKRWQSGWIGLLFSSTYALMGYIAVYNTHVMWLDALILLPIVALGIRKIAEGGKPFLYIAALGLTIVCQYYIGYMVCLFSLLYFLYNVLDKKTGFRVFLRRLLTFAGASILAAGLAAVVLIPAVYAVMRGYTLFDANMLTLEGISSAFGILTKLYTASVSTIQFRSGAPNLYIGIPLLAFALLYFCCRAVPLRKRLLSLGFAAVFIVSFLFAAPYYLWHAFNAPNYFPARFSFLFSFLLIELAWQGYREIGTFSARRIRISLTAIAAAFLALTTAVLLRMRYIEYLAFKTVVMDAVLFCGTCLLVFCLRHTKRMRTAAILLICAMQVVCLLLNAYYPIVRLNQVWSATASAYTEETERGKALVRHIKAGDGGLYRMEFNYHRSDTVPFAYDYFGLTHFSPDADAAAIGFAEAIGLHLGNNHLLYRAGTTPVLESLLGVKYLLQIDDVAFAPLPEGYTELWRDSNVTAYENTYSMPFTYLVPEQTRELADEDPFVNQNTLLSDLTGEETQVFEPVTQIKRAYDGEWETYTFPVEADRQMYLFSAGSAYVFEGTEATNERMNGTIRLPVADVDTAYTLKMTAPLGIRLAYFDMEAFRAAQTALAVYGAQVESDTDSHLVIQTTVTDDHTQLLITLPYDPGWQAWVDGDKVETVSRYGALLAVNLSAGEHTVELRFVPRGLWAGAAISGASIVLVVLWMVLRLRRSKV
jgi:uncharacterized membrane protein YfhO